MSSSMAAIQAFKQGAQKILAQQQQNASGFGQNQGGQGPLQGSSQFFGGNQGNEPWNNGASFQRDDKRRSGGNNYNRQRSPSPKRSRGRDRGRNGGQGQRNQSQQKNHCDPCNATFGNGKDLDRHKNSQPHRQMMDKSRNQVCMLCVNP